MVCWVVSLISWQLPHLPPIIVSHSGETDQTRGRWTRDRRVNRPTVGSNRKHFQQTLRWTSSRRVRQTDRLPVRCLRDVKDTPTGFRVHTRPPCCSLWDRQLKRETELSRYPRVTVTVWDSTLDLGNRIWPEFFGVACGVQMTDPVTLYPLSTIHQAARWGSRLLSDYFNLEQVVAERVFL